jgi:hypothetical protein
LRGFLPGRLWPFLPPELAEAARWSDGAVAAAAGVSSALAGPLRTAPQRARIAAVDQGPDVRRSTESGLARNVPSRGPGGLTKSPSTLREEREVAFPSGFGTMTAPMRSHTSPGSAAPHPRSGACQNPKNQNEEISLSTECCIDTFGTNTVTYPISKPTPGRCFEMVAVRSPGSENFGCAPSAGCVSGAMKYGRR